MKERLDYIDRARGILIILMVIGHIWQSGFVFDMISAFHMPAFFVISGFLMNRSQSHRKPLGLFTKTHILRFVIPFLFIETLGVLTDIVRNGVTLNIKGYIYNTLTLEYNDAVSWFLVVLCLTELLFWLCTRIAKSKPAMCILTGILFCIRYFLPVEFPYISTLYNVFKYLPFFVAGYWWNEKLSTGRYGLTALCSFVVLLLVIFSDNLSTCGWAIANMIYLVKAFCGSYVILQISRINRLPQLGQFFAHFGQNSIITYGTHHFYYGVLGVLLGVKDFSTTPLLTGIAMLVVVLLLEIPTIYIINRWLPFLAGKHQRKPKAA